MIVFVFNFLSRIFIDWSMKVVRSAHLCHAFQYLSDIHVKKRKGKNKEIQILNRKENMIALLSLFSRRFPTKFLLFTRIAEVRLVPRIYHCKAPAKRVQHFIQHHTTLMFYEILHSFGHLVVSCFIMLYLFV